MQKVPIAWLIDDGIPLARGFSNAVFGKVFDVIERHGFSGKFSIIPNPGNRGEIARGMEGVPDEVRAEWLEMVKNRIAPGFSLCPEMITHADAYDLSTGGCLPQREDIWSQTQDRSALTPYVAKALSLLKEAGLAACGVTSPWDFGVEVEEEYVHAISEAVFEVFGRKNAWYFCRGLVDVPGARPWIALEEGDRCVVAIPNTTEEWFWESMKVEDASEEYVSGLADRFITADGRGGDIPRTLDSGGIPILFTHLQSLLSAGRFTGLRAMDLVGQRVAEHFSHRVQWMSCEEILQYVVQRREEFRIPEFLHRR